MARFALRLAVSEKHEQGRQKSEIHLMTPNWPWTFNSQKYTIYTNDLPLRSKFSPVSLYDLRFPRYCTFYHFLLTTMLNVAIKEQKKKICQNMHEFLGANLLWNFRQDVFLSFFSPIWSHVNEKKKKVTKIQNFKFRQSLYNFGRDPP